MFFKNDIESKQLAMQAVNRLRSNNSKLRRQSMKKRLDYYYGKQLTYLDELIKDQFKFPDRLKLQKEFLNITEMIVNELAVLYSMPPKRELQNESEEMNKFYSDLIHEGSLDQVMAMANRLTKLCKTILVRPVWRDEKIEFDILTPNMFDVIQDPSNPTKALGIVYVSEIDFTDTKPINNDDKTTSEDSFDQNNTIFYVWTKDKHFSFSYSIDQKGMAIIDLKKNQNNEDNTNPYGVLPFVCLYDGLPVDNFFVEGGDDLINANEISNIKLTEKNYLTKMQSFSQLVRKGADNTKDAMNMDPSMILDIPADDDIHKGIDIKFINPEAKIQELEDDIHSRLTRIAIKHKLNPEMFIASGDRSSADSLQMQAYYLGKVINADKPLWAYFERELYKLTAIINNYENSMQLPVEADFFIDYKDVEVPSTIEQDDAHNLIMFQNGLISKADWLMRENPDVKSKEQAEEMVEEIQEEKMEAMKQMVENGMSQMQPKTPLNGQDDKEDDMEEKPALENE